MKALFKVCFLLLCFTALSSPAVAQIEPGNLSLQVGQSLAGKVIDVASGETFTMVTPENRQIEVWLAEIEAPEKGQVYFDASRAALSSKVLGKEVSIQVISIKDLEDGYDYVIAMAYIGNRWINLEMVAEGWAWNFPQYLQSPELATAEQQAKVRGLGVWVAANPDTPWANQKLPQPPPEENQIQPLFTTKW